MEVEEKVSFGQYSIMRGSGVETGMHGGVGTHLYKSERDNCQFFSLPFSSLNHKMSTDQEKKRHSQVTVNSFADDYDDFPPPMSEEDLENEKAIEKKLVRMLDYRLLVWAFFGYFANGLDRNNMPNAYTSGMPEDLGLVQDQYNWAVTLFFIGYVM